MIVVAIVLFLLCLALFLMVWRDSSGMTLIATPFLAFAGTEMLAMWTATLARVPDDQVRGAWAILVVTLAFVAFLGGFVVVGAMTGVRREAPAQFRSAPIVGLPTEVDRRHYATAVLLATLVLLAMGGYLYQGLPPQWAAFRDLLRGADIQEAQGYLSGARFLLTKSASFGGEYRGQGFILAVMNIGWPFVTGVAAVIYRGSRRKGWLTAAVVLFLLTVTFVGGTGQRGPVVMAILFLFVLFSLLSPARTRHVIAAGVTGMAVLMFLTITSGTSGLGTGETNATAQVGLAAVQRLPKNGTSTLQTIEFVDAGEIPLGWGGYQRERLIQSLPGPSGPQLFCHRLHLLLHPTSTATTCASMTQIGQWYPDFGIVGSTAGYFGMGALAAVAQGLLFRLRKGPLELPLVALATMGFMELALGGVVSGGIYFALLGTTYLAFRITVHRNRGGRSRGPQRSPSAPSDLSMYLRAVRHGGAPLAAALAIGATAGWAVSSTATPHYRATATLLVSQVQSPDALQVRDLAISETLARTLAPLLSSRPVVERALADVAVPSGADEVVRALRVTAVPSTQLVRVSAIAPEPAQAAQIANAVATAALDSDQARALLLSPRALSIVEAAAAPVGAEWPRVPVSMALGTLLTGLGGLAVVLLRAYLDQAVKTGDDAVRIAGLRTLGRIHESSRDRGRGQGSPLLLAGAEAYRAARTNLAYTLDLAPGSPRVLLVTSPGAGDGRTSAVANLAVVFGLAGARVCAVDGNLRRPALHRLFGLDNTEGLSSLLISPDADLDRALRPTPHTNVSVLTSGPAPIHPADLLEGARFAEVIAALQGRFDLVLVDSPPVLGVGDTSLMAASAHATVLVIRPGATRPSALREAVSLLGGAGTQVVGVLWNRARSARSRQRLRLHRTAPSGLDW